MRLLHTSDWHLGRSFHGVGLLAEQRAFLTHLVDTARAEQVDLVVVAGDVYDRALPPVDAVEAFDDALARLAEAGIRTLVTSGNHDSPVRLGTHAALADAAGIHLRTRWQGVGTPVLVPDRYGDVAVYGVPFLEPDAVRLAWDLPARSHDAAMRAALHRVSQDLAARGHPRSVVAAHAFVAGSVEQSEDLRCDSERDISVGGVQLVPTALFRPYTYTALGHLHGPAALDRGIRYSGSPVAYSFSEAGHEKGSWLVEIEADGVTRTDFVPAPVTRRLAGLEGPLEQLLADPAHAGVEDHWLAVTLTDRIRPAHAMERLRRRFPHTLTVTFAPEGGSRPRPAVPHVSGRSDLDVALGFVQEVRDLEPTTEESLLLQLACESCRADADPHADRLDLVGGPRVPAAREA